MHQFEKLEYLFHNCINIRITNQLFSSAFAQKCYPENNNVEKRHQ